MPVPEEYIEIANFTPGIWSDIHAGVTTAMPSSTAAEVRGFLPGNGAATVENTFSCRADKTGALIPMPSSFSSSQKVGHIPANAYSTATRPAEVPTAYLLDAEVSTPRWYDGLASGNIEQSSIYTLWGFFYAPAADGVANGYYDFVLGREYRLNTSRQPVYDYLWARSTARFSALPFYTFAAGSLALTRLDDNAKPPTIAANGVHFDVSKTTPVMVAVVSMRHRDTPSGLVLTTGAIGATELTYLSDYYPPPGGVAPVKKPTDYSPTIFPNATLGRVGNTVIGMSFGSDGYDIGAAHPVDEWSFHTRDDFEITTEHNAPFVPSQVVAHQGRIVMPDSLGLTDFQIGVESDPVVAVSFPIHFSDDLLWYSRWGQPIGDVYTQAAVEYFRGWIPIQIAEDQVAHIDVVGVVTADELLIVKTRGGGAVVRGDLDNPTVRRLPHIESTHGVASKGAQTPIGYVYGTKTGVFAYDGGDTTRKLSRQLDGFFWDPYSEDVHLTGPYGRFAYWNGMVFVPNNYVYDIDTDSWWRLFPFFPKFNIYAHNNIGQLWAFPHKVDQAVATTQPVFNVFNIDELSATYSWQSQPLVETRGRRVSVQNVIIVCTAKDAATYTITITGYDEKGASISAPNVTLTCAASTNPQILRKDIAPNFTAEYVQVRIQASSATDAPKTHSLRLGIRPRQTTPRHG